jgi:hypothetical protein
VITCSVTDRRFLKIAGVGRENLATALNMLQTFVLANETQRILMLEKTNFNLGFLKTIVEVVSDSSVLQASDFSALSCLINPDPKV